MQTRGHFEPLNYIHTLCKIHNIFISLKACAFLQTLVALKSASCSLALVALKRTGCEVWQMECQASNITANVQSDHLLHEYMLPIFFVTDQLYHPPCSAEIQPMSQQDAAIPQLIRIANWYSIHVKNNEKDEIFVQFLQGSEATFSNVVGKEVTVCFLLR